MSEFCDTVRRVIGDDLAAIGARGISDDRIGEEQVCFYAVDRQLVAISFSAREDATCRISASGAVSRENYRQWQSLWSALNLDRSNDTEEGLAAYWQLFPQDFDEYLDFMGKCLLKYFSGSRDTEVSAFR